MRCVEAPRCRGKACVLRSIENTGWGSQRERAALMLASREVTPFLEALGGDVAAIGFTAPPSAFVRPRGLSSSSRRPGSFETGRPLPRTWALLQRPYREPPTSPWLLQVRFWMAPPMDFVSRSAFAANRVGHEAGHSKSSAIPSQRFSRPQGFNPLLALPPFADG